MDKSSNTNQDLVRGLIAVLSLGIQENQLDDSEILLDAIKALSPGLSGIDEFSAYIAIKRGQIREALQMYAATPSDDSKWFVMMALCLKLVGDPTWHWHATQSLERDDPSARYAHNLATILLGGEKVENAGTDEAGIPVTAETIGGGAMEHFPDAYASYRAV